MRHCKCPHVPERLDQFVEALNITGIISAAALGRIREYHATVWRRGALPPPNRLHDRALAHVTAPDHHGHQHWTGPIPPRSGPRVQYQGKRMPVAHWLWLRAGNLDLAIERTCRDPQCIAPGHHRHASVRTTAALRALSHELARFDAQYPQVNPRPNSWDKSDPMQDRCKAFGHPLTIYGDVRERNTYCSECYKYETWRKTERAKIEQRADWNVNVGTPLRAADYSPDGPVSADLDTPTLADEVEALFRGQPYA